MSELSLKPTPLHPSGFFLGVFLYIRYRLRIGKVVVSATEPRGGFIWVTFSSVFRKKNYMLAAQPMPKDYFLAFKKKFDDFEYWMKE